MKKIDNLIIFGDSLSDIGNKRESFFGKIARLIGAMRTNDVGRFSDNRNWTDFIWEWSGGTSMFEKNKATTNKNTDNHQKLTKNSNKETPRNASFFYANYAEGGAMGASDRTSTGLGVFKSQQEQFIKDATALGKHDESFLFLVWFGLNDIVTNHRDPNDMRTVADEICELCKKILVKFPNSHFLIGNSINPKTAVRYAGPAGLSNLTSKQESELSKEDKKKVKELNGFTHGALELSLDLFDKVALIKHGSEQRAQVVDLYSYMEDINENSLKYGIINEAQPKGVAVRYDNTKPPLVKRIDDKTYQYATTSDKAHPTEAIYKLIANVWAQAIKYYPNQSPLPDTTPIAIKQELALGTLADSGETQFTVAK